MWSSFLSHDQSGAFVPICQYVGIDSLHLFFRFQARDDRISLSMERRGRATLVGPPVPATARRRKTSSPARASTYSDEGAQVSGIPTGGEESVPPARRPSDRSPRRPPGWRCLVPGRSRPRWRRRGRRPRRPTPKTATPPPRRLPLAEQAGDDRRSHRRYEDVGVSENCSTFFAAS